MKAEIEFEDFLEIEKKLDIKLGTIREAIRVEGSNKMLKLSVDFGSEFKTVMTNIGNRNILGDVPIELERDLVGQTFPFIVNLKPTKIMGVMSYAMIMVAEDVEGNLDLTQTREGSKLL